MRASGARVCLVAPRGGLGQVLIEYLGGEGFSVRSYFTLPDIARANRSGERGVAVVVVDELSHGDPDNDADALSALSRLMPVIAVSALPTQPEVAGCHVLGDVFSDLDGLVSEIAEATATLPDSMAKLTGTM